MTQWDAHFKKETALFRKKSPIPLYITLRVTFIALFGQLTIVSVTGLLFDFIKRSRDIIIQSCYCYRHCYVPCHRGSYLRIISHENQSMKHAVF